MLDEGVEMRPLILRRLKMDKKKFKMTIKVAYDTDCFSAVYYGSVSELISKLKDYELDQVYQIIILPYLDGGK